MILNRSYCARYGKIIAIFFTIFYCTFSMASQYSVQLGNTTVIIKKWSFGSGKSFVHLHHNETTALKAAKIVARKEGGSVLTLIHPGQRNIRFIMDKQCYEFDPNRIFTDRGIKKTLIANGCYSYRAHRAVKLLAKKIEQLIPEGRIIAVHNNKDYSIKVYTHGAASESDAKALYLSENMFFRNFFLVTQTSDFQHLKNLALNVVLQASSPTDDGSLSVHLKNREYVNVEAGYDQLKEQIEMLKIV